MKNELCLEEIRAKINVQNVNTRAKKDTLTIIGLYSNYFATYISKEIKGVEKDLLIKYTILALSKLSSLLGNKYGEFIYEEQLEQVAKEVVKVAEIQVGAM